MKRLIAGFVAVAALSAVALTASAVSLAAGESGPKCADLDSLNFNYKDLQNGSYTFGGELLLTGGVAPCKQVTYTLTIGGITGVPGGQIVLTQQGSTQFPTQTFTDSDNQVCVSATTSSPGGHVYDRGPDSGCVVLTASASGGKVGVG